MEPSSDGMGEKQLERSLALPPFGCKPLERGWVLERSALREGVLERGAALTATGIMGPATRGECAQTPAPAPYDQRPGRQRNGISVNNNLPCSGGRRT